MITPSRVNWNGFRPTDMTATELKKLSLNTDAPGIIEQDGRIYDVVWSGDIVSVKRNEANKGYVPAMWAIYDLFERRFSLTTRAAAFETRLNALRIEQTLAGRRQNLISMIDQALARPPDAPLKYPDGFIRLEARPKTKTKLQSAFTLVGNQIAKSHTRAILALREKADKKLRDLKEQLTLPTQVTEAEIEKITGSLKKLQSHLAFIDKVSQNHNQIYLDHTSKIAMARSPHLATACLHRVKELNSELNLLVSSFSINDDNELVCATDIDNYYTFIKEQAGVLDAMNFAAINSLLTPPALKAETDKSRTARADVYKESTVDFIGILRDHKSTAKQVGDGIAVLTEKKRQLKHQMALGAEISRFLGKVPAGNTFGLKHLEALAAWRDTCLNPKISLRADNLRQIQEEVENCVASINMGLALSRCIVSCHSRNSHAQFQWRIDALKKLELACNDPSYILTAEDIDLASFHMGAITEGDRIASFLKAIEKPGLFNRSPYDKATQARINTLAVLKVACYSGTVGKTGNNAALHAVLTQFEGIDFIRNLANSHMEEINKSMASQGWPCLHELTGLTHEDWIEQGLHVKTALLKTETAELKRMTMEAQERLFERGMALDKLSFLTTRLGVSVIKLKEESMKFHLGQTLIGQAVNWFSSASWSKK